jgi:serine/threonine-protein kinase
MGERFKILSFLQRTPVGRVYYAIDQAAQGTTVLVKELVSCPALDISDDEVKDRYERELKVLSTIFHPAVPRLLEHFIQDETYYVILEYFEGETLESLSLKRTAPFPPRLAVGWGLELCEVLALFHNHKPEPIIFRDVRPSSVIITPGSQVKLADFGITRFFHPVKVKDTFVMGSAGFSPPEQYGKEQSDRRSDIYSLGATLFYLLTLRTPDEFMKKLPSLQRLNEAVPAPLERLVYRCIQKERSRRYQAIEELETALREIRIV